MPHTTIYFTGGQSYEVPMAVRDFRDAIERFEHAEVMLNIDEGVSLWFNPAQITHMVQQKRDPEPFAARA